METTLKKRIFALIVVLMASVATFARVVEVDGLYYDIDRDEMAVGVVCDESEMYTSTGTYTGDIVIPSSITVNDTVYPVKWIYERAFHDCEGLTSVSLPNTLTIIGWSAFENDADLTSLTLPASLTDIYENAFLGCGFKSLTFPKGVTEISGNVVKDCQNLESLQVEEGNPVYNSPEGSNCIMQGNTVVMGCKTSVIPQSATTIGANAFENMGITSISIPSNITNINRYGIRRCGGLKSLTVEEGNPVYDSRDGSNCIIETATNTLVFGSLTSVIPSSVDSIGNGAFYDFENLTSMTIPEGVRALGPAVFFYCTGLKQLYLPSTLEYIDYGVVDMCSSLEEFHVNRQTPPVCNKDAFELLNSTCILYVPEGTKELYAASVGWSTFNNILAEGETVETSACVDGIYYNLSSDTKEAEVTSDPLGNTQYSGSIVIPETITTTSGTVYTVTSIGKKAFYKCDSLTAVSIPRTIKSSAKQAFYGCDGLTRVDITSIAAWCGIAFGNYGNPVQYARHLFVDGQEVIDLVIPDGVESIGDYAFNCLTNLKSVTIPASMKSIGKIAFDLCNGIERVDITDLTSWCGIDFATYSSNPLSFAHHLYVNGELLKGELVLPAEVKSVGMYALRGCSDLESVVIPATVDTIGSMAFGECENLVAMRVEAGNANYDSREDCNAIIRTQSNTLVAGCKTSLIPNTVTEIGAGAFYDCKGLQSITVPNSVTTIGSNAFGLCPDLTSVTLGNGLTSIDSYGFMGCSSLDTLICYTTEVPTAGFLAFYDAYNATLYVPEASVEAYKASEDWGAFSQILPLESIPTGLSTAKSDFNTKQAIFDLTGKKHSLPQKGINIVGGKKIIVK